MTMAITTNVHFVPTTDSFGNLIVHTRRVHGRAVAKAAVLRTQAPRRNANTLMVVGFLASLMFAAGALYAVDQAVFAPVSSQVQTYGGVTLDYD